MSYARLTLSFLIVGSMAMISNAQTQTPPAPATSSSPSTKGSRAFEMRTYYALPGKAEDLHKRFRDHTTRIFKKHGMESIGYWVPNDKPDVLVYILAHPSRDAAEASWKAFREDPEWIKVRTESEANGKIVDKVESVWLSATDYSAIR
jgi:hypothetical protein